jgi:hypothetical protein
VRRGLNDQTGDGNMTAKVGIKTLPAELFNTIVAIRFKEDEAELTRYRHI